MSACEAIQAYLDGVEHAVGLPLLIAALPELTPDDIKAGTRQLYEDRAINRVLVKERNGHVFYVFYSLYIRTANIYRDPDQVAIDAEPETLQLPAVLSPDQAVDVLQRGGWTPEPEVVTVERRVSDRRAQPRLAVMDVLERWCLPYRLARIVEIVASTRRRSLTLEDAALVRRLVREHVTDSN